MSGRDVSVCGDDLLLIRTGSVRESARLAAALHDSGDWLEAVPGIGDVVVRFDAASIDAATARERLSAISGKDAPDREATVGCVEIPVAYGGDNGPDLERLCNELGLSPDEFVALHTGREYTVDMLGFTPGFAYVGGLDERLDVPRLDEPRARVPAGSIGIAGGRTGVYALAGPGGWPLIGRTRKTLYDPDAEAPFLLEAGMRVRFSGTTA